MTGSNRTQNVQNQLKPDSNRTRPAQIGFDRLKPDKDQTGSNQNQTGPDRLKSVLNSSNQNIPAQPNQPRPERLKPDQTGPDRLKPVLNGSNQTIPAQPNQTGPEQLKPDQTGPDRLKPVLTDSNRRRAAQTEFHQLKPD